MGFLDFKDITYNLILVIINQFTNVIYDRSVKIIISFLTL